ncbi:MAG: AHH domain-containing protein [Planctomycetes bacterium]|nr:AHH domain-containing protein [Planctomycetota bacterium]
MDKDIFIAAQYLPWMEGESAWWSPFFPNDPVGFSPVYSPSSLDLTLDDVRYTLGHGASDANMYAQFRNRGGPAFNAIHRYKEVERNLDGDAGLALANSETVLNTMRAKEYLTDAVKSSLKLNFTLTKDQDSLPYGTWTDFGAVGGALTIREPGWLETTFHYGSPVEDLFNTANTQHWDIGNAYTEEVMNHMLAERFALASAVLTKIQSLTGGSGSPNWPFNAVLEQLGQGGGFPDVLRIDVNLDKDAGGFVFKISDSSKAEIDSLNLRVQNGGATIPAGLPEFVLLKLDVDTTDDIKGIYDQQYKAEAGDPVVNALGLMEKRLFHDLYYLNLMRADLQTVAWWQKYRTSQPVGYGLLASGDFIFGVKDMLNLRGQDFVTGESLSPAEYALTGASVLVNLVPGSVFVRTGKAVALRAARASAAMKGLWSNIKKFENGRTKLVSAMEDFSNLTDQTVTRSATQTAETAFDARRGLASGSLQRLGKVGIDASIDVIDSLAAPAQWDVLSGLMRGASPSSMSAFHVAGATFPEITGKGLRRSGPQRPRSLSTAFTADDKVNKDEIFASGKELVLAAKPTAAQLTDMRARGLSGASELEDLLRGGCFLGGTRVVMADGSSKSIEDISPGERVRTRDQFEPSAPFTAKEVSRVSHRSHVPIRCISFCRAGHVRRVAVNNAASSSAGDEDASSEGSEPPESVFSVSCTTEHPFWVVGAGWKAARSLIPGQHADGDQGELVVVANREIHGLDSHVYNIEVQDCHTYEVLAEGLQGALPVWVHNTCDVLKITYDNLIKLHWSEDVAKEVDEALQRSYFKTPTKGLGEAAEAGNSTTLATNMKAVVPDSMKTEAWQAHHINPTDQVKSHPLFKGFVLPDGTFFPASGFKTNDPFNGVILPKLKEAAKALNVPNHNGFHAAYSAAMKKSYDDIQAQVIAEYNRTKSLSKAVLLYDEQLKNLTERARTVLEGTGPNEFKDAFPLYANQIAGSDVASLIPKWYTALQTGVRP